MPMADGRSVSRVSARRAYGSCLSIDEAPGQGPRVIRIARCNVAPVPSTGEPCQAFQAGRAHPTSSGFDHRHLRDIDAPAAKPAFAVHEVESPEVVERLFEAAEVPAGDRLVIALPPSLEGFGIVAAETLAMLPRQTPLMRKCFELRF